MVLQYRQTKKRRLFADKRHYLNHFKLLLAFSMNPTSATSGPASWNSEISWQSFLVCFFSSSHILPGAGTFSKYRSTLEHYCFTKRICQSLTACEDTLVTKYAGQAVFYTATFPQMLPSVYLNFDCTYFLIVHRLYPLTLNLKSKSYIKHHSGTKHK